MTRDEWIEELAYYGDIEMPIECPYTMGNCYNLTKNGHCRCNKCEVEKAYIESIKEFTP